MRPPSNGNRSSDRSAPRFFGRFNNTLISPQGRLVSAPAFAGNAIFTLLPGRFPWETPKLTWRERTLKTTKLRDAITFALAVGATAAAGTGIAFAQDAAPAQAPADQQAKTLDRIEVTG